MVTVLKFRKMEEKNMFLEYPKVPNTQFLIPSLNFQIFYLFVRIQKFQISRKKFLQNTHKCIMAFSFKKMIKFTLQYKLIVKILNYFDEFV